MNTESFEAFDRAVEGLINWLLGAAYVVGAWLVGLIVLAGILDATIRAYGFVFGIIIGIIPAVFIGGLAGALWPLWALILWHLFSK